MPRRKATRKNENNSRCVPWPCSTAWGRMPWPVALTNHRLTPANYFACTGRLTQRSGNGPKEPSTTPCCGAGCKPCLAGGYTSGRGPTREAWQIFPMQANGAEMLRLACCLATEREIAVCAPVHDALLVEGPTDGIQDVVAATQDAMAEASHVVLAGFELRSDAKIVRHPERYSDPRGEQMWKTVMGIMAELPQAELVELAETF